MLKQILIKIFFASLKLFDFFFKRKKFLSEFIYSLIRNNSIKSYKISNDLNLLFFTPNYFSRWRAETLLTKEEDTIEWIKNFEDNSIFWDIGANVGVYSLYAKKIVKNIKVVSFEPSPQNFAILTKNITINKMDNDIIAIPNPLDNENGKISYFIENDFEEAGSKNSFCDKIENTKNANIFKTVSISIDKMISDKYLPTPNYIKIDVDGNENRIIEGAKNTLDITTVRGILIECNKDNDEKKKITNFLNEKNFKLIKATIVSKRSGNENLIFSR